MQNFNVNRFATRHLFWCGSRLFVKRIKTDTFSARAWRGHDCVLLGLKTLLFANFQHAERLKLRYQINYVRLKWIVGAFNMILSGSN